MSGADDVGRQGDLTRSAVPGEGGRGWAARNGDVVMPVERAEWWGSSLGVLVAAIHHPHLLAAMQPDTDPVAVAQEVLDATIARGATGYAASAWSGDIGRAAGTLPTPGPRYLEPPGLAVDGPDLAL
jgi:hypothetical protein